MKDRKPGETGREKAIREKLRYDPETGYLHWRIKPSKRIKAGARAGRINSNGYRQVQVDGKLFYEHRVVWFLVHGRWPEDQLNHRNCDEADNRIENLEEVTTRENHQRRRRHVHDEKLCGVSFQPKRKARPWRAQIWVDGKHINLGNYADKEEAHTAYLCAVEALQFVEELFYGENRV